MMQRLPREVVQRLLRVLKSIRRQELQWSHKETLKTIM